MFCLIIKHLFCGDHDAFSNADLNESHLMHMFLALSEGLPANTDDALNGEDSSDQWKAAREAELAKMIKMNVMN
jgi:hypothetical protein